jgi:hypothetical protein
MHFYSCDAGHRWCLTSQGDDKIIQGRHRTVDMNVDTLTIVGHRAGQGKSMGQAVDKRPESHPLHHTVHSEPPGCCLDFAHVHGQNRRSINTG